ncbi:MAG: nucleotidyltransferase family protein [Pseudomonadota bacterium]
MRAFGSKTIQTKRHLVALLGAGLPEGELPRTVSQWDWSAVFDLAVQTKTLGLVCKVVDDSQLDLADDVKARINQSKRQLLMASLFNLEWTIKVTKALQTAGIETLVLKGPIQSSLVYGRWDIHRSGDVDLLVRPERFKNAGDTLVKHGFQPVFDQTDQWWVDHLGEEPYHNPNARSPIIDLHHRVQQPGGPFPRDPERFFADSVHTHYSGEDIPVLSVGHGAVLAAISYGKALAEGAPWMHYTHELATVYARLSSSGRDALRELAVFHGVHRLLDDALVAGRILFAAQTDEATRVSEADYDRVLQSAFGMESRKRLFRSRKLWAWTDGALPERVVEFGRGLMRVWQSEMARIAQEKDEANRSEPAA